MDLRAIAFRETVTCIDSDIMFQRRVVDHAFSCQSLQQIPPKKRGVTTRSGPLHFLTDMFKLLIEIFKCLSKPPRAKKRLELKFQRRFVSPGKVFNHSLQ